MRLSGEQLQRAAEEMARVDARLGAELRRREFKVSQFLPDLEHALSLLEIHESVSKATRAAWKVLRALRVEGD